MEIEHWAARATANAVAAGKMARRYKASGLPKHRRYADVFSAMADGFVRRGLEGLARPQGEETCSRAVHRGVGGDAQPGEGGKG